MVGTSNALYGEPPSSPQTSTMPDLSSMLQMMARRQGQTGTGGAGAGKKGGAGSSGIPLPAGQAGPPAPISAAGNSGFMSNMASAGPWAALAAAIIANESKQRGDGNRGNSGWEHAGDLVTGKVLERDIDRYMAHNPAGDVVRRVGMMGTPSGVVRNTKDLGSWMKGLFS